MSGCGSLAPLMRILAVLALVLPLLLAPGAGAQCESYESYEWSIRSPAPVLIATVEDLNVRSGPGREFRAVDRIEGPQVVLYAMRRCGDWADVLVERDRRDVSRSSQGWIYIPLTCTPRWAVSRGDEASKRNVIAPTCEDA